MTRMIKTQKFIVLTMAFGLFIFSYLAHLFIFTFSTIGIILGFWVQDKILISLLMSSIELFAIFIQNSQLIFV